MQSKKEFYKIYFEQLARKGFDVKKSTSSDYVADIYRKGQLIAFYTKTDTIKQNPFVQVKEKFLNLLNETARSCALKVGICLEQPYTEENEKLENGTYKLSEYNGVILACKHHPLFEYVFSTFRLSPEDNKSPIQRQFYYSKEAALQDYAVRSGLVDEKNLFTETELKVLHTNLVSLVVNNNAEMDVENMEAIGKLIDKIEEIVPELHYDDTELDFENEFEQGEEI